MRRDRVCGTLWTHPALRNGGRDGCHKAGDAVSQKQRFVIDDAGNVLLRTVEEMFHR